MSHRLITKKIILSGAIKINHCEEHLNFKGDCCPVCLQNQIEELKAQLKEKDAQLTKISIESIKSGTVHKVQVDDFEKENAKL